jgi:large subunit ribosomal protein L16
MPLIPKRVKYRKAQRGNLKGKSLRGADLAHGEYGLKALEPGYVTTRQIESARLAIARTIKKGGKIFPRVATDKPVTKKPLETRMGKGKGEVETWVAPIRPGRILIEVVGTTEDIALRALRIASEKLPIKTKIVSRQKPGV